MSYKLAYTHQAGKDAKKLSSAGLAKKTQKLLELVQRNPWQTPPPFERLVGDLKGAVSRRINIQHRLVYQVIEEAKTVKVLRMFTHYE